MIFNEGLVMFDKEINFFYKIKQLKIKTTERNSYSWSWIKHKSQ